MPVALVLYQCCHLLARWTRGRSETPGAVGSEEPAKGMYGLQRIEVFTWHQLATAGPIELRPQLLKPRSFPSPPVDLAVVY